MWSIMGRKQRPTPLHPPGKATLIDKKLLAGCLLGFEPTQRTDAPWCGVCPWHGSSSGHARLFSVHVARRRSCCHKCGSSDNPLERWAAFTKTLMHPAMVEFRHVQMRLTPLLTVWGPAVCPPATRRTRRASRIAG